MTARSRMSPPPRPVWRHANIARPLEDDGFADVKIYNDELVRMGSPTWLNTNWLYSECYLYR